jgi:hypothetical protein
MDSDIEQARTALRGAISGGHDLAQVINDMDPNVSEAERRVRRQTAADVRDALQGVVDLGALLIAVHRAVRDREG